jgi:hypothetical protein
MKKVCIRFRTLLLPTDLPPQEESRVHKFILCTSTDASALDLAYFTRRGICARDIRCKTKSDGQMLALVHLIDKMRRSDIMRKLLAGAGASDMEVLVASGETKEEYDAVLRGYFTAPAAAAATTARAKPSSDKKNKKKAEKKEEDTMRDGSSEEEDEDDEDEDDDEDDEDDEEETLPEAPSASELALREQIAKLKRRLAKEKKKSKPPPSALEIALREEIVTLHQEIEVFPPVLTETHAALAAKYEERTARYETRSAEYDALAAKHAEHVKFLMNHGKLSRAFSAHWNTIQLTLKYIDTLEKRKKTQADELALMTARRDNLQKRRDDAAARKRAHFVAGEWCDW